MAETDIHRRELLAGVFALEERYRLEQQVYVAGNLLLYYEEGNPRASVAPDLFVVFEVEKKERRIYKVWEEGKAPELIIEFTSRSTREKDLTRKRWLYESLGVKEYFLFDPLEEYLHPKLQGFRLSGQYYTPLVPESIAENEWKLKSQTLGIELLTRESRLLLFDPQREKYLLSPSEEAEARRMAETRAHHEAEARRMAETRAHHETEARRMAETRAHHEAEARQIAETRAHYEAETRQIAETRANNLETELKDLQAELTLLRKNKS